MKQSDKDLLKLYLGSKEEDLMVSIGRILAASEYEAYRAGMDDLEKIKKNTLLFFKKNEEKLKEIICDKLKLHKLLDNNKFEFNLEGAVLLAEILEQSGFIPIPLNYPLVVAWIVKKRIYKLCD